MQYPQQRLAECRCVLTVRRYAQQHDQQQPELVLEQHQHHKITKLVFALMIRSEAASFVLRLSSISLEVCRSGHGSSCHGKWSDAPCNDEDA